LSGEIGQALASGTLPADLSEAISEIRIVGNIAAGYPLKSGHAGLLLDVELGEAEWSLDVLERLFDFYFVQPARVLAERDSPDKDLPEADVSSQSVRLTVANVAASSRD
jgi:hypothetical protein